MTAPAELLAALAARGYLAAGERAHTCADDGIRVDRPWFVSLLLAASAWLAGVFMLVFIAIAFRPDLDRDFVPIGIALLAGAWGLFRVGRDAGSFATQFGLVMSIAGQFALLFGLETGWFRNFHGPLALAACAFVIQSALLVVMPNRLQRTLSCVFACAAWAIMVRCALWDGDSWRSARALPGETTALGAALSAWIACWIPVAALLVAALRSEASWMAAARQSLMRPLCSGLVVGLAWGTLLSQPFDEFTWNATHDGGLALWPLLSLLAATGALAAAFALRSTALTGACVVAALLHVSQFYYVLGVSLLAKSLTMLALGGLALMAARRLKRHGGSA